MQYPIHKGIEVFGQPGINAVKLELKQLHDQKVIVLCNSQTLFATTKECRSGILDVSQTEMMWQD